MSYLALYRKYRPNSFDEMVGQNNVVKVIKNAIINDKISHAYLFSGPRGTGKTTTAKIIAKMVNCLNLYDGVPCGKCDNCKKINYSSDVVEIDAASNNGVDEIREIREKVNLVPSELKYKIYIIDEVHMLTTQAFNALLKTLEEPPKHIIFILATTEFYKIPLTIVSRCQHFQFSKIDADSMVDNLKRIVKSEKILVDDDVLYEISKLSDGCCRDAVNLLDQLVSYSSGKIDFDQLYEISGSVSFIDYAKLLDYILENDNVSIIEFCDMINDNGKNIYKFVEEFLFFLKDIISCKSGVNNIKNHSKNSVINQFSNKLSFDKLYFLIYKIDDLLSKIKMSSCPSILLSVFLIILSKELNNTLNNGINIDISNINNSLSVNDNDIVDVKKDFVKLDDRAVDIRINNTFAFASKDCLKLIKNKWEKIDDELIDSSFSSIGGILKDCIPVVASKNYLIVSSHYESLVDRFNSMYIDVEKFLKELLGFNINVVAISDERWLIEKNKYIENLKNGIKYEYTEINNQSSNVDNVDKKNNQSDLDMLKDLVGNDIIECVD